MTPQQPNPVWEWDAITPKSEAQLSRERDTAKAIADAKADQAKCEAALAALKPITTHP